jgi:hypothetical protein
MSVREGDGGQVAGDRSQPGIGADRRSAAGSVGVEGYPEAAIGR